MNCVEIFHHCFHKNLQKENQILVQSQLNAGGCPLRSRHLNTGGAEHLVMKWSRRLCVNSTTYPILKMALSPSACRQLWPTHAVERAGWHADPAGCFPEALAPASLRRRVDTANCNQFVETMKRFHLNSLLLRTRRCRGSMSDAHQVMLSNASTIQQKPSRPLHEHPLEHEKYKPKLTVASKRKE